MAYKKTLVVTEKAGTFDVGEYPLDEMTVTKHREATKLVARGRAKWELEQITSTSSASSASVTTDATDGDA